MCKQVKLLPCLASLELAVVSVASCGLEFSEPQQLTAPLSRTRMAAIRAQE